MGSEVTLQVILSQIDIVRFIYILGLAGRLFFFFFEKNTSYG